MEKQIFHTMVSVIIFNLVLEDSYLRSAWNNTIDQWEVCMNYIIYITVQKFWISKFMKGIIYAHQDSIYLIKNILKQ